MGTRRQKLWEFYAWSFSAMGQGDVTFFQFLSDMVICSLVMAIGTSAGGLRSIKQQEWVW